MCLWRRIVNKLTDFLALSLIFCVCLILAPLVIVAYPFVLAYYLVWVKEQQG